MKKRICVICLVNEVLDEDTDVCESCTKKEKEKANDDQTKVGSTIS